MNKWMIQWQRGGGGGGGGAEMAEGHGGIKEDRREEISTFQDRNINHSMLATTDYLNCLSHEYLLD